MDSSSAPLISISEDGECAAQLNGRDLTVHLNPATSDFKETDVVRMKENASRFLKLSRLSPVSSTKIHNGRNSSGRRILCASDVRILIWQLCPLRQCADIEGIEPGTTYIDFGADQNEIIVFSAWNTKLTVFNLDSRKSQVIKAPKSFHSNYFEYRPKTRQLAILLKPDSSDLLTVHEFRSYELIGRAILPTVDAQGLKWSPDGRWIAVWDTASTGTKVLIFTADGRLFRTYTGMSDLDDLDLGVKSIEWGPVGQTGRSELLAVAKVDGNVDILKSRTFTCSLSISHIFRVDQGYTRIWHERNTTNQGLGYIESSNSCPPTAMEPFNHLRGITGMAFSPNALFLATVDQMQPEIVWIWALREISALVSILIHEHPVRQIIWHPSNIELLITTTGATVAVRHWAPSNEPVVIQIPISGDGGRCDAKWVSSAVDGLSRFWIGTPEEHVVGHLSVDDRTQFEVLDSIRRPR